MKNLLTDIEPLINQLNLIGEVYIVGGAVRDHYMNIEPKDIDLLITNIPYQTVLDNLYLYGKVDEVGKSFGIIKFKPFINPNVEYDIALPRIDKKTGNGHKGFQIISDHNISLIDDLQRRDVTFNAMAWSTKSESLIDPFNGLTDISNKIIKAISLDVLIEDPLRILRIIQFASRFNFDVDPDTLELMTRYSHLIKDITPERRYIEFKKVFDKKGNIYKFAFLLEQTNVYNQIFGSQYFILYNEVDTQYFKPDNFGELLFYLCRDIPLDIIISQLKPTNEDIGWFKICYSLYTEIPFISDFYSQVKRLSVLYKDKTPTNCYFLINSLKHSQTAIEAWFFLFKRKDIPKNHKEAGIDAYDLMSKGFTGKNLALELDRLLIQKWKELYEI
jgi:tRNA nucleotidyltransferase/poly(A) polymerase